MKITNKPMIETMNDNFRPVDIECLVVGKYSAYPRLRFHLGVPEQRAWQLSMHPPQLIKSLGNASSHAGEH